jgi:hypothetical protein
MFDVALQKYLRQFEPLKSVQVGYRSEMQGQLAPFLVLVHGFISLHGHIHQYEVEVDMREMHGPRDLERLAGMLIQSFELANHESTQVH